MFEINEDKSINITRGDIGAFTVDVLNEAGEKYLFQKGDVVRIKVTEKKACENVMFQKDFVVTEETEQVEILLTEQDTKIGEVISKPTDYWYEIELNPFTNPQTIIGYDDDGAKIFKLFPEGKDIEPSEDITPEDIPVVDEELDLTSERPVQNHVIAKAFLSIQEEIAKISGDADLSNMLTKDDLKPLESSVATNTGNIEDITTTIDTHTTSTNPHNVTAEQTPFDNSTSGVSANNVQGAIDELSDNVADVQTQIDTLEEFGYWTPNATTASEDRNYYIKTKNMLHIFFTVVPGKDINTTNNAHNVCTDVKETFGIDNFKDAFTLAYAANDAPIKVFASSNMNVIALQHCGKDVGSVYGIYGQISLCINQ